MKPTILFVIHGWCHWDSTNGNSYHAAVITSTQSGRQIALAESPDNMRAMLVRAGFDYSQILETPIRQIKWRTYQAITKNYDHKRPTPANIRGLTKRKYIG